MIKLCMVPKLSLGSAQPQLIMINIPLWTTDFVENMVFSPYAHPLVPFSNLSIHKSFYLSFLNLEKYLFIKLHFVVILSNITPSPQDKLCLSNKTTLRYNIFNNILNAEPSIVPFFHNISDEFLLLSIVNCQ